MFLINNGKECLNRVAMFPLFTLDTSFAPEQERKVLLDIYESTNGQKWFDRRGWTSLANEKSHCSWYGITCHGNTSYVKTIVLAYNNLDGSLPSTIWKIRNLFSLCVVGNPNLHGRLDDFLFGNMTNLLSVGLTASSVGGYIPEDFTKLRKLQNFMACPMNGNGISGRLPQDIGNMRELRLLGLGGNNISGEIPRSISRLNKLWYLDLRNNPGTMFGRLSDLLSLSSLRQLFVSGIHLTGRMPRVLPQGFWYLVLPGNNISGTLPKTFKNNTNLRVLNVANNRLTGDIPGDLLPCHSYICLTCHRIVFLHLTKERPGQVMPQ